jgi:UDP-glucose 6-dehydrogenase
LPRVTVIGTGILGLTHAVCMADLGHEVLAIDVDAEKIAKASGGEAPFLEPGLEPLLRKNLDEINLGRRDRVVALAREAAGGSLKNQRVTVLGVAFKPNSDDVRDSPSLAVCDRLVDEGAAVSVHDPVAMPSAARKRPGCGTPLRSRRPPRTRISSCTSPNGPTTGPSTPPRWPGWSPAGGHRRPLLPGRRPLARRRLDRARAGPPPRGFS